MPDIWPHLEPEIGQRAEREADAGLLEVCNQPGVLQAPDAVIHALHLAVGAVGAVGVR